MSNGHAKLSPSNSKRWLTCTASVTLPEVEEGSSSYANRGTAIHAYCEDILSGEDPQESYEDYTLTEEDIQDTAEVYIDYCQKLMLDKSLDFIELKVFVTDLCYGTADFVSYDIEEKTLHVVDLKAGKGVFVFTKGNTQLQIYALGAMRHLQKEGHEVSKVITHVVQPGMDNIVSVDVDLDELEVLHNLILKTELDIADGKVKYEATDEGCRWCPHKLNCKELNTTANQAAAGEFEALELSEKMQKVSALKTFIKAVEEKVLENLQQEKSVPGYKLVQAKGKKVWANENDAFSEIIDACPEVKDKLMNPGKIRTVIQVNKELKKLGYKEDDFSHLVIQKEGGIKVVEDSNPAEAIDKTASAVKDFS